MTARRCRPSRPFYFFGPPLSEPEADVGALPLADGGHPPMIVTCVAWTSSSEYP